MSNQNSYKIIGKIENKDHIQYASSLPCENELLKSKNEYEIIMLLKDIKKDIETIKKQISAHDYNISKRFK